MSGDRLTTADVSVAIQSTKAVLHRYWRQIVLAAGTAGLATACAAPITSSTGQSPEAVITTSAGNGLPSADVAIATATKPPDVSVATGTPEPPPTVDYTLAIDSYMGSLPSDLLHRLTILSARQKVNEVAQGNPDLGRKLVNDAANLVTTLVGHSENLVVEPENLELVAVKYNPNYPATELNDNQIAARVTGGKGVEGELPEGTLIFWSNGDEFSEEPFNQAINNVLILTPVEGGILEFVEHNGQMTVARITDRVVTEFVNEQLDWEDGDGNVANIPFGTLVAAAPPSTPIPFTPTPPASETPPLPTPPPSHTPNSSPTSPPATVTPVPIDTVESQPTAQVESPPTQAEQLARIYKNMETFLNPPPENPDYPLSYMINMAGENAGYGYLTFTSGYQVEVLNLDIISMTLAPRWLGDFTYNNRDYGVFGSIEPNGAKFVWVGLFGSRDPDYFPHINKIGFQVQNTDTETPGSVDPLGQPRNTSLSGVIDYIDGRQYPFDVQELMTQKPGGVFSLTNHQIMLVLGAYVKTIDSQPLGPLTPQEESVVVSHNHPQTYGPLLSLLNPNYRSLILTPGNNKAANGLLSGPIGEGNYIGRTEEDLARILSNPEIIPMPLITQASVQIVTVRP